VSVHTIFCIQLAILVLISPASCVVLSRNKMGNACCTGDGSADSSKAVEVTTSVPAVPIGFVDLKEPEAVPEKEREPVKEPEPVTDSVSAGADTKASAERWLWVNKPKEEEPAPAPKALAVEFLTADGKTVSLSFTKRPLGMNFASKLPISVTLVTPQSHAEEIGVKEGWQILAIGGRTLKDDKEFEDFNSLVSFFRDQATPLPQAGKKEDEVV